MNWYEKIAHDTRLRKAKLNIEQTKEIKKVYEETIKNIAKDIEKGGHKPLTERWLKDYHKELKSYVKHLDKELNKTVKDGILKGSQLGIDMNGKITDEIFKVVGIDTGNHFSSMFSSIQDNVITDIISGNLYKDKKTLSNRIWNFTNQNGKDIQSIITEGIAQKRSAIDLASDLEQFIKPPAKRLTNWGRVYKFAKTREVDYNAMRLARTSINHAYQNATIQGSQNNPFIEGIKWESALIHGRTCQLCIDRDGKIFKKDEVPLDHPNGLCTMIPYVSKDLEEIGDEIREWINGKENKKLDNWYRK
ncbi:MAG: hypothetical protein ACTJGH_00385 [Peptoniphilaceae bacterium]